LLFGGWVAPPVLADHDRYHLERVLRVRRGEPLTVSDGKGAWRPCRYGPVVEASGPVGFTAKASPNLTVGFSIPKGDRPELIVQKLTELGIDRIVALHAERSVVRWDGDRASRHLRRLRRVAREAAMQARRAWLPEVEGPLDVAVLAASAGAATCEPGGGPPTLECPVLLVGPEGGWSHGEAVLTARKVALGPHVLRVETAALSAGVLLAALRSRLVAATPIVVNDALRG
jgi:16S rRNA (uracil1498-N3)-methyltransferase